MRTIPTKSTADFYVLKRLLLFSAYETYKKYGFLCFRVFCIQLTLCIKTITSFTVRTKPTKSITVVFFVFKTITSFTVRTTPTKSTVVSRLKLLRLQCFKTVVFFVFKTITSFTVRTTPTKSTFIFYKKYGCIKTITSCYSAYETYKKYGCFLCIVKTITSFTVHLTTPTKSRTVVFFAFKTTTSFTVRTTPTKSTVVFYVLKQ